LIVSALAIWAAFDGVLLPGVRWFMRRRLTAPSTNSIRGSSCASSHQARQGQALIDQLIFDPEVFARHRGVCGSEQCAARRPCRRGHATCAGRSSRPSRPTLNFGSARSSRAGFRCSLSRAPRYMDEEAMKTVDPDAAVIFVLNHRSNMDYVAGHTWSRPRRR